MGMVDIRAAKEDVIQVEIMRNPLGQQVVYVNVNGLCALSAVCEVGATLEVDQPK